jgi:tRNA1(Val) A37 N6-methylase TrmN6
MDNMQDGWIAQASEVSRRNGRVLDLCAGAVVVGYPGI